MGATLIQRGNTRLIFGLGVTGVSLAKYLIKNAIPLHIVDAHANPPHLAHLKAFAEQYGIDIECTLGDEFKSICEDEKILEAFISQFHELLVSPGVKLTHPLIQSALKLEIPVENDVGIFIKAVQHSYPEIKTVAITGSNGKSTVTDATAFLGQKLGFPCYAIGNIGTPVLDVFDQLTGNEILVMELSSYQLELLDNLGADVAVLLNLSEDHLDRHGDMHHYWLAKQKIFEQAKAVVVNKDDPLSSPMEVHKSSKCLKNYIRYGLSAPDLHDFGLLTRDGKKYLAHGISLLTDFATFQLQGPHNLSNMLSVLAIAQCLHWPLDQSCTILSSYPGLEFRCQIEKTQDQVTWVNDSKGTNVGASIVALQNGVQLVKSGAGLWWIAGGLTKGASFTEIADFVKKLDVQGLLKGCLLYGQDKAIIQDALMKAKIHHIHSVNTLEESVKFIKKHMNIGDAVIFSPACASMDQFKNYIERGQIFSRFVQDV